MKNKYTFEDWLNDKIDYRIPGKLEASDDLTTLSTKKLISQEDYNKIRKAQEETFDASFIMALETFKRIFSAKILKAGNSYLEGMRDYYKRIIDRNNIHNPTMFDGVMLGFKCLDGITGSQYREIKALWKCFKKNKIKHVTKYPTKYLELFTNYSIYEWLEEYANQEQSGRREIPNSVKTFKTNINIEELKYLYNNLKGECIANDTDFGLFKDVFSDVPVVSM